MAKMDDVSSPKLAYMLTQQSFDPDKCASINAQLFTPARATIQLLTDQFSSVDVKDLASKCELAELQENRQRIQTLNDETAVALKKNVYKNYTQFIETSKEISCILSLSLIRSCQNQALLKIRCVLCDFLQGS